MRFFERGVDGKNGIKAEMEEILTRRSGSGKLAGLGTESRPRLARQSFATVQMLKRVVKTESKAAEPKPLLAVL